VRPIRRGAALGFCLLVACSAKAPQDANAGAGTGATLRDFRIALESANATAVSTTFDIANDGPSTHEFVVLRTDVAPDALPVDGDVINEDNIDLVDEVEDVAPGTLTHLTVDLTPGRYVLVCNIAGHYSAGMHVGFTVT